VKLVGVIWLINEFEGLLEKLDRRIEMNLHDVRELKVEMKKSWRKRELMESAVERRKL